MDDDAWDHMSSEYDNSVEKNPDHVISNYLLEEIRIIGNLCKKVTRLNTKCTIIDMGSGTGRVLFALRQILGNSVSYCGIETSKHMIQLSEKKLFGLKNHNVSFLNHDVTDPAIGKFFDDDSVKIVMCVYNTVGVIDAAKIQQFFDNMIRFAGKNGLAIVSAFNGDDFVFTAPRMYIPMKKMVRQIDGDSFDEKQLAFKNNLGYHSQWFTKNQISKMLDSNAKPIPINVHIGNGVRTMGHVFSNRNV